MAETPREVPRSNSPSEERPEDLTEEQQEVIEEINDAFETVRESLSEHEGIQFSHDDLWHVLHGEGGAEEAIESLPDGKAKDSLRKVLQELSDQLSPESSKDEPVVPEDFHNELESSGITIGELLQGKVVDDSEDSEEINGNLEILKSISRRLESIERDSSREPLKKVNALIQLKGQVRDVEVEEGSDADNLQEKLLTRIERLINELDNLRNEPSLSTAEGIEAVYFPTFHDLRSELTEDIQLEDSSELFKESLTGARYLREAFRDRFLDLPYVGMSRQLLSMSRRELKRIRDELHSERNILAGTKEKGKYAVDPGRLVDRERSVPALEKFWYSTLNALEAREVIESFDEKVASGKYLNFVRRLPGDFFELRRLTDELAQQVTNFRNINNHRKGFEEVVEKYLLALSSLKLQEGKLLSDRIFQRVRKHGLTEIDVPLVDWFSKKDELSNKALKKIYSESQENKRIAIQTGDLAAVRKWALSQYFVLYLQEERKKRGQERRRTQSTTNIEPETTNVENKTKLKFDVENFEQIEGIGEKSAEKLKEKFGNLVAFVEAVASKEGERVIFDEKALETLAEELNFRGRTSERVREIAENTIKELEGIGIKWYESTEKESAKDTSVEEVRDREGDSKERVLEEVEAKEERFERLKAKYQEWYETNVQGFAPSVLHSLVKHLKEQKQTKELSELVELHLDLIDWDEEMKRQELINKLESDDTIENEKDTAPMNPDFEPQNFEGVYFPQNMSAASRLFEMSRGELQRTLDEVKKDRNEVPKDGSPEKLTHSVPALDKFIFSIYNVQNALEKEPFLTQRFSDEEGEKAEKRYRELKEKHGGWLDLEGYSRSVLESFKSTLQQKVANYNARKDSEEEFYKNIEQLFVVDTHLKLFTPESEGEENELDSQDVIRMGKSKFKVIDIEGEGRSAIVRLREFDEEGNLKSAGIKYPLSLVQEAIKSGKARVEKTDDLEKAHTSAREKDVGIAPEGAQGKQEMSEKKKRLEELLSDLPFIEENSDEERGEARAKFEEIKREKPEVFEKYIGTEQVGDYSPTILLLALESIRAQIDNPDSTEESMENLALGYFLVDTYLKLALHESEEKGETGTVEQEGRLEHLSSLTLKPFKKELSRDTRTLVTELLTWLKEGKEEGEDSKNSALSLQRHPLKFLRGIYYHPQYKIAFERFKETKESTQAAYLYYVAQQVLSNLGLSPVKELKGETEEVEEPAVTEDEKYKPTLDSILDDLVSIEVLEKLETEKYVLRHPSAHLEKFRNFLQGLADRGTELDTIENFVHLFNILAITLAEGEEEFKKEDPRLRQIAVNAIERIAEHPVEVLDLLISTKVIRKLEELFGRIGNK